MALAIKSVPVLKGKAAAEFIKNADAASEKMRGAIDFTKQAETAAKIIAKAKL